MNKTNSEGPTVDSHMTLPDDNVIKQVCKDCREVLFSTAVANVNCDCKDTEGFSSTPVPY